MLHFQDLAGITGGTILQLADNPPVHHLLTDSRKPFVPLGTLFFSIGGIRHDGHTFIRDVYARGGQQFIVERHIHLTNLEKANVLLVDSSIKALQKIAAYHRSLYDLNVLGVTGSNGKTIIKEWIYQLIGRDHRVVKNPGSYNSQIGLPLSVWQIDAHHDFGIFEAGISRPGEMEKLRNILRPSIGLFTNIGPAHNEGFQSLESKIHEKLSLFKEVNTLIYCKDHVSIDQAVTGMSIPSFTWGRSANADFVVFPSERSILVTYKNQSFSFILPFTDTASTENCLHCISLMVYLGYSFETIQDRISTLRAIPMRLELKEGINHCYLINDTYNNDLGGLKIGLDFLSSQRQKKKKTLILSDILQSGLADEILVQQVADLVNTIGLHHFISIGPILKKNAHLFKVPSYFYSTVDEFLRSQSLDTFSNEIILIKGARIFQFEKIVDHLQRQVHGAIMEIDLGALVYNLNFFKSRLHPGTKTMVMVKAFAYGSGLAEVANVLQYHNVDYLGVAYTDEGVSLRKNNITLPIMVMNPSEESFSVMMAHRLEPEVYNLSILHSLIRFLDGSPCTIHIKIDTGMRRLGFEEGDIQALKHLLVSNPHLHVATVFSHLAGSDEKEHDDFTVHQAGKFLSIAQDLTSVLKEKPLFHLLNSSGILRFQEYQFDMVRLGIGLYGVNPTLEKQVLLRPVATLKTVVSQIKEIKTGESIGYSRKGRAYKPLRTATIAIGYADGYSRAFSQGRGEVLIRGKRAPVIGNVCMDMTMVDITGIDAHEGDEVIIFGPGLDINEVASKINTIPYEILTSTRERIKRIFISEGI